MNSGPSNSYLALSFLANKVWFWISFWPIMFYDTNLMCFKMFDFVDFFSLLQCWWGNNWFVELNIYISMNITSYLITRMKISVITDISVTWFYGYIGYIGEISADILEKNFGMPKCDQNSWTCKKNLIVM